MVLEECREVEWILWAGTVGFQSALPDRFAAATAQGCRRVSLSPADLLEGPEPPATVGARARDLGLQLLLDPLMNWYPTATPPSSAFAAIGVDDALRAAEAAGVVAISAITVPGEPAPPSDLAGHFASLCDRVAGFGAEVQLEFIPFTSVATLRQAWPVVRDAGRDNGGVLVDLWHFHRGEPDHDLLATVPGEKVLCVQLCDAPAVAEPDVRAEAHRRLLPGRGELDLLRTLRVLDDIGALRWVGPEVLHPDLAAMPVAESAALAMDASRTLLARL
ncbi:sugar phosphate isomerase/epimerase family protein [Jatrophihabitans fulvus]